MSIAGTWPVTYVKTKRLSSSCPLLALVLLPMLKPGG